jgi:DNA-binding MarR family transcriptional regulator
MRGADRAVAAFIRIERAAGPASFEELMELEFTMAQFKALLLLDLSGPVTVSRFAEAVGTKLPAASVFVDRLEQARLVVRGEDGSDRRRVVIELTEEARRMIGRLRGNHERVIAAIDRLPPAAQDALAEGMEALAAELERERDSAPDAGGWGGRRGEHG